MVQPPAKRLVTEATAAATYATKTDLAAVQAAVDDKAPIDGPSFIGTVAIGGDPIPGNLVGTNLETGATLVFSDVDPGPLDPSAAWVLPSDKLVTLPATKPTSTQVVTIGTDGKQGAVALSSLGTASTGTTTPTTPTTGGTSRAQTARALLATAGGVDRRHTLTAHPAPPVVSVYAGSTSTITGAVRVALKRTTVGSATIDVTGDPHWELPGARPGQLTIVGTADRARAAYLTGGTAQNRRDYWRERTEFSGTVLDFSVMPATGSLSYRVWVDGLPVAVDMITTPVTAGSNYVIRVDFGTDVGPRVVELEVNDPWLGGAWIGPTDSLSRYRTPRRTLLGFGDSHTAGANGVSVGSTWLGFAARHLGLDPVNAAIGGSGFLVTAGGGTVAPNFRSRITPDVTSMAPDLVVFFGGYNDVSVSTAAAIGAEAQACYTQLATDLPNSVVIAVGPICQSHNVGASFRAQDDAQRAAAAAAGIPYISLIDPLNQFGTTPAWAAATAYVTGDHVTNGNTVWKCMGGHTSGATFTGDQPTRWRAVSFVTGTGKSTGLAGNGNADVIVSSDGIHMTAQGHKIAAYFLASEITRILKSLAS